MNLLYIIYYVSRKAICLGRSKSETDKIIYILQLTSFIFVRTLQENPIHSSPEIPYNGARGEIP